MSTPLIITRLIGGLGNQLFQYSVGRHLAKLNGGVLKLDASGFDTYKLHAYALEPFALPVEMASREEVKRFTRIKSNRLLRRVISHRSSGITRVGQRSYVDEESFAFDQRVLDLRGSCYLNGYWQSERYFAGIRDELRSELTIRTPPDPANQRMAGIIADGPSATIHVRLGDYLTNPGTQRIHGLLPESYYREAIGTVKDVEPDVRFFLFSDDPAEAIDRLPLLGSNTTVVDINDASRNFEDLRLMTLAKHHILANSSFSWWGAWLRKKEDGMVIAPARWFTDRSRDTSDLLPPDWVVF